MEIGSLDMAGKSLNKGLNSGSPANSLEATGKDRDFHTFENAPGPGAQATGGSYILEPGDGYIYHVFTGDGTFSTNPNTTIQAVEYMLVGGGGSGGQGASSGLHAGGGGGGGGFVNGAVQVTGGQNFPITIGGGGGSAFSPPPGLAPGGAGSPTTGFDKTAYGGGGGAGASVLSAPQNATAASAGGEEFGSPSVSRDAIYHTDDGGWQGHSGGQVEYTAPWGSPTNIDPAYEFSAGGGGAGGTAYKPPTNMTYSEGQRVNSQYTRGKGKQIQAFPIPAVADAYPAPQVSTLAEPYINGWGSGGSGSYTNAGPTIHGVARPSNGWHTNPTGANSGGGGNGGGGPFYHNYTGIYGGNSGVAIVRYRKQVGDGSARATGGNVVEPGNNTNHLGVVRHIFTSPGTFTVTDSNLTEIRYLAVGGGGAGYGGPSGPPSLPVCGSGGGAGGFVTSESGSITVPNNAQHPWSDYPVRVGSPYPVGLSAYPVVIGTGGAYNSVPANSPWSASAGPGNNTTFGTAGPAQIVAYGGAGGVNALSGGGNYTNGLPGQGSGSGGASYAGYNSNVNPGGQTTNDNAQGTPGFSSKHPSPPGNNAGCAGGGGGAGGYPPGIIPLIPTLHTIYNAHGGWGMWSPLSPPNYGTDGPVNEPTDKRWFAGGGASGSYYGVVNNGTVFVPDLRVSSPTNYYSNASLHEGGYGGGGGPSGINGDTNTGGGGAGDYSGYGGGGGPGIMIIEYPA